MPIQDNRWNQKKRIELDGDEILLETADEYGFPLNFPSAVLAKMQEQLGISQEVFHNIHNYFDAANNLYARIPLRVLHEIYNSQNSPVTEAEFLDATEIISHERNHYAILQKSVFYEEVPLTDPIEQELVAEHIYALDYARYYELEKEQEGKPWYIPSREDFLKYTDSFYTEETPQFLTMTNFLRNTQRKLNCPPREVAEEQSDLFRMDYSLQAVIDDLQRLGVRFQNQSDFRIFVKLCLDLSYHSRRYNHRGHTPAELGVPQQRLGDAMKEVSYNEHYQNRLADMAQLLRNHIKGNTTITAKPAKNAPCPCGSGRKYKNCCGKGK